MGSPKMASGTIFEFKLKIRWKYTSLSIHFKMVFDDSLPIERYQNPKSKNTVSVMGNVFSATDCTSYCIKIFN